MSTKIPWNEIHCYLPQFLEEKGLMVASGVIKEIERNSFEGPLLPVCASMGEIFSERLSARGAAWTWGNRSSIHLEYRSEHLSRLRELWEQLHWATDARLNSNFFSVIDPRLAAYWSMPYVDLERWIDFSSKQKSAIDEESAAVAGELMLNFSSKNFIREAGAFVATILRSVGDVRCRVTNEKSVCDVALLSCNDERAVGEIVVRKGRGKFYVDAAISLYSSDSTLLIKVPLELLLVPYGDFYLSQRKDWVELFLNLKFISGVFEFISNKISGEYS